MSKYSNYIFKEFIDNLQAHRSTSEFRMVSNPKFVFLCGKNFDEKGKPTNRDHIKKYLENNYVNIFCIYAEHLWQDDTKREIDLLTFEDLIAEISDFIILFVESAGSICELGAFMILNKILLKKLIIVVDKSHEHEQSFINLGPIRKARENNVPVFYIDLNAPLSSNDFIETLKGIKEVRKKDLDLTNNNVKINIFIIEILEIITLLDPIRQDDLVDIYKDIFGYSNFDLVKSDGKTIKKISPHNLIKMLIYSDLIFEKNGYLYVNNKKCSNYDFVFSINKKSYNKIRNRMYVKKYKAKYGV